MLNTMKNRFFLLATGLSVLGFLLYRPMPVLAEPTPEDLRSAIRQYVGAEEQSEGFFSVVDPKTGTARKLKLERVHERVGKTGNYYYSCADLKDVETGDLLDLDFDVSEANSELKVADVRIHKDNGNPRYTYDANDNRVPVQS